LAAFAAACLAARASSLIPSGAGGGAAAPPAESAPPLEGGAGGATSPFILARRLAGCDTGPTLATPLFSFSPPAAEGAAAAAVRIGQGGFLAQAAMAIFHA